MKYLYCSRCKDLRVKSWYAISNRCPICLNNATPIAIPRTWLTYVLYASYVLSPASIVVYLLNHDRAFLYTALVLVFIMMAISWIEIGRGRDFARTKVKLTVGNVADFRKKGWS